MTKGRSRTNLTTTKKLLLIAKIQIPNNLIKQPEWLVIKSRSLSSQYVIEILLTKHTNPVKTVYPALYSLLKAFQAYMLHF